MANQKHLAILAQGVEAWNAWRQSDSEACPDLNGSNLRGASLDEIDLNCATLVGADLRDASLAEANLSKANLSDALMNDALLYKAVLEEAELRGAILCKANLNEADLTFAQLEGADLRAAESEGARFNEANLSNVDLSAAVMKDADFGGANLRGANLLKADLEWARLDGADFSEANLTASDMSSVSLVGTNLAGAKLDGSRIYGASVWDVIVNAQTSQRDLVITPQDRDAVTVDELEVAQFIYLLLKNQRVRKVIDTITSKVVLILGRFSDGRKQILDALRNELRKLNFTPVLFDFERPSSRDLTETISTLAHMARFVIADITDAKSIPQELMKIVPNLPSLPIRPIILDGQYEYAMFKDFGGYLSMLPPWRYKDSDHLLASLETEVIGPALNKAQELAERRKAFEQELMNG